MTFILLHLNSNSVWSSSTTERTKGHKNSMRSPWKTLYFFTDPKRQHTRIMSIWHIWIFFVFRFHCFVLTCNMAQMWCENGFPTWIQISPLSFHSIVNVIGKLFTCSTAIYGYMLDIGRYVIILLVVWSLTQIIIGLLDIFSKKRKKY